MNILFPSTSREESKIPVAPKTPLTFAMSSEEKQTHLKSLTYLVPGTFVHSAQRTGKGKKGSKHKLLHMPSPAQAQRLDDQVYTMIKTYQRTQIQSSTTIPISGAFAVDFNSINDSGSLVAVFDMYRIALVEVTFIPDANISAVGATYSTPMFYSAVDLDDIASITALQLQDYPGVVATTVMKQHKHTFVPHCALAAYSGAFTSYANVAAPWIDVASPAVQHFGVKYAFGVTGFVGAYEVIIRIKLELKHVR